MGIFNTCLRTFKAEYTDSGFSVHFGKSSTMYCKNCKENEMHCIYQTQTKSKEICVKCLPKKVERKAFKATTVQTMRSNHLTDTQKS